MVGQNKMCTFDICKKSGLKKPKSIVMPGQWTCEVCKKTGLKKPKSIVIVGQNKMCTFDVCKKLL